MNINEQVKLVAELAREVNKEDPIDFEGLQIDSRRIWDLIAHSVVEKFLLMKDTENSQSMYLATITKLVVENFVLNHRILTVSKKI